MAPTELTLNSHVGRLASAALCSRRNQWASEIQAPSWMALPMTAASYPLSEATSATARTSTSGPAAASDSARRVAISAVEPWALAWATRTRNRSSRR